MSERNLLMIPGPTNNEPSVLRASSKPTLSHTDADFVEIYKETLSNLKKIFMTDKEVFAIAGSGTLALEMGIANIIEPDDDVLNTVAGLFGKYFARMTEVHGAKSKVLEVPWGKCIEPEMVKNALKDGQYQAVTVTHVETSTGVVNPIEEIGDVVRKYSDALYVVDTVCSLGGMEVRVDDWNIDVCVSGSQKCMGVPPGLALLALGDRALNTLEARKTPVHLFYGDLKNWLPIMRDPKMYFATPPVNMIFALSEAQRILLSEGLEQRFRRHNVIADAFRTAMSALDLKIVAEKNCRADTVTAVLYPENIDDANFRLELKKRGVIVAGGLGPLKGKSFRVGHIGNVSPNDIMATVAAIEATLKHMGYTFTLGTGFAAAEHKLCPPQ